MNMANASKLITCILPMGAAMPVQKQLKQELGIITASINHARGSGKLTPRAYRGVGEQTEKEILTVVVDEQRAEQVFTFIFHRAQIDRPHGGLIFQSDLTAATAYLIPQDLPVEE